MQTTPVPFQNSVRAQKREFALKSLLCEKYFEVGFAKTPTCPKASPLYGLVEDHFDEFERVYDDRFALKKTASGGRLSARSSTIDSWIAATCGNTFASIVVSSNSCVLAPMPPFER
jgi:hypothetical protein